MQIQRVKNALLAPFLLADEVGAAQGSLNEFTLRIKELVDEFTQFFIIIGPDGQETYSEHGQALKEFVIAALNEAVGLIRQFKEAFLDKEGSLENFASLLHLATAPLRLLLWIFEKLPVWAMKLYVVFKLFTALLPITNIMTMFQYAAQMKLNYAMAKGKVIKDITMKQILTEIGMFPAIISTMWAKIAAIEFSSRALWKQATATTAGAGAWMLYAAAIGVAAIKLTLFVVAAKIMMDVLKGLGAVIATFAALQYFGALADMLAWYSKKLSPPVAVLATAATGLVAAGAMWVMYDKFVSQQSAVGMGGGGTSEMSPLKFNKERTYDGGGTYLPTYDNGGMSTEHGMAILQKGESVIPKTQNMLGGGITLNMGDVNVQDGEDFAERVAAALPGALQRVNDSGAI
jgi:hypothetical protein